MFGPEHYVPIAKGKKAEYDALHDLTASARNGLTPLLEIPPVPWDFVDDAPASSLDDHVDKSARRITSSWEPARRIFIDVLCAEAGATTAAGDHPLAKLFSLLRAEGTRAVPVTGPTRPPDYQRAVRDVHAADRRGVCLRLSLDDLEDATQLRPTVDGLMRDLAVDPAQTDLVVDFGALAGQGDNLLHMVASPILTALPYVHDWRTVTFAFAAFPKSVSEEVSTGSRGSIPRHDAAAWQRLHAAAASLSRVPTFGDYGADNPAYVELDPRIITPAAHIRYTVDDEWLIFRGRALTGAGSPGYEQFHDLATAVAADPRFAGGGFSEGDRYIEECATRATGTGNLTTWRWVATNHHLTLVTSRLATVGVP